MNVLEQIEARFGDEYGFLYPTGFENAVIGLERLTMRLILSKAKIINIMMKRDNMKMIDALKFFSYKIEGKQGEMNGLPQPIYLDDFFMMEFMIE
jgi:hypothetical protein